MLKTKQNCRSIFFFLRQGFLHSPSPSCPGTSVDQVGFRLTEIYLLLLSKCVGLKVYAQPRSIFSKKDFLKFFFFFMGGGGQFCPFHLKCQFYLDAVVYNTVCALGYWNGTQVLAYGSHPRSFNILFTFFLSILGACDSVSFFISGTADLYFLSWLIFLGAYQFH